MINIIRKTIAEHNLINKGDSVLVGLSGGADSVCLTHALFSLKDELGITIYTAHVNHGIRGAEAERDEEFAKNFSKALDIECYVLKADVPAFARTEGISEEAAGRQERYGFFYELCEKHGIDKIATAHNKNDNAETLLMNFMRGSSVKGLCGIPYSRGNIIRPLLDIAREEIEKYCKNNGLEYMTDSTNSETIYTRNKIRHTLLPLIQKEFNPNFTETVTANSALINEDSAYIEKQAKTAFSELVRNGMAEVDDLQDLDIAVGRRVIRLMIKETRKSLADIPAVHVNDVLSLLNKNSGTSVNLPDGITARIEYGRLVLGKTEKEPEPFEYTVGCGMTVSIPEISSEAVISAAQTRKKDGAIYLSYGENDTITIRSRREGDVFLPYGMTGSKKVKEFFINEKIPRGERCKIPIIEINGEIAAVGSRVDRRFLFNDKGIRIEFKPIQEVIN